MTALTLKLNSILRLTDEKFYQLCRDNPELKLEQTETGELVIMSPTGGETGKQNAAKMQEYQENGNRLGWLIDPASLRVAIYRSGQPVEILDSPAVLASESVLPGFVLHLQQFWQA